MKVTLKQKQNPLPKKPIFYNFDNFKGNDVDPVKNIPQPVTENRRISPSRSFIGKSKLRKSISPSKASFLEEKKSMSTLAELGRNTTTLQQ